MRKTKIVCTMGPSTEKPGILRQLMENGMNVARFNFSHGDYEEHKGRFNALRALSKELDLPVAAMLDTKGPEIRLGTFKNGVEKLVTGQKFTLTSREVEGTNEILLCLLQRAAPRRCRWRPYHAGRRSDRAGYRRSRVTPTSSAPSRTMAPSRLRRVSTSPVCTCPCPT